MLALLVGKCGHRATCATSGEEALAVLDRDLPDLVILDAMMPGMDGPEVLRQIRGGNRKAAVPVVMLSAVADPAFQAHMISKGANDYWVKATFDYGTLPDRLQAHLPCQ
jgi:CheY-like chemotaxis protein